MNEVNAMSNLNVAVVQSNLMWEDRFANHEHIGKMLMSLDQGVDVVVLPEMFTTGFSMNTSAIAEVHDENMSTLVWMREHASRLNAVVCGSVSVSDGGVFYNRLYWVRPDGSYSYYNKRHTFSFAGEDMHYAKGDQLIIEEWKGWRICPLICYDLRFPVWSRNGLVDGKAKYDCLIYVANWPSVRREPWMKLLLARAIENQVFLAAGNRVGKDGNDIAYTGDSMLINPRGEVINQADAGHEQIIRVDFVRAELEDFRLKFPVLHDADDFTMS